MDEDEWESSKIKNTEKVKCKICKKKFTEKSGLYHHVQLHSADKPYSCHLCTYTCKTKKYLSKHVKVVHVAATEHECSYCGKKFHYRSKLKDHLNTHTNLRPYKCDICGKGFNSTYSLTTHSYIHQDAKPFKCLYCDYACRDSSTLRKHHERHTGLVLRVYQCATCLKTFHSKSKLRLHVTEVHLAIDLKTKPCDECGKLFKSTSALKSHIKIVHQRIYASECDICGLKLSNKYNMDSHLRSHVDLKPFKCGFNGCNKRYKDKSTLKKHSVIHYPEKHMVCDVCDRRFTRVDRFNKHKRQHVPRAKTVSCDQCGVSFYNKNYLRSHMIRKHLVRQRFVCDTCGFCAHNKPGLVAHLRHGHDEEWDKQCKICHKKYKKHIYLKSHYWNTHFIKYRTLSRPKKVVIKEEPVEEPEPMDVTANLLEVVKHEISTESEVDPASYSKSVLAEDLNALLADGATATELDNPEKQLEALFLDLLQQPAVTNSIQPNISENADVEKYAMLDEKCEEKAQKRIKRMLERARRRKERQRKKEEKDNNVITANEDEAVQGISEANCEKEKTVEKQPLEHNSPSKVGEEKENIEDTIVGKQNEISEIKNEKEINRDEEVETDIEGNLPQEANKNNVDNNENHSKRSHREATAIIFNSHQCYKCFKIFDTKVKLLEHCKEHYDICNDTIMKKCPFCDYVTKLNLARHIKKVHDVNIKIGPANLKESISESGSRYFYSVENDLVKKIDVIPSVKNLNKRAYMKLDKLKRQQNKKTLQKTKLIKKDGEWIVENRNLTTDGLLIPDLKKLEGDYFGTLKKVATLAKNNGKKILYPCNKCDKICQTFAALKLHYRHHDPHKKPFKPKVWKHKTNTMNNIDSDRNKKTEIDINHRYEKPKPIVNKHKCDPKLKEFYESNIKGGDIEFWQFLKIFNKMTRDNVNDFKDLENRSEFGIHFQEPVNDISKPDSKEVEPKSNVIEINTTVKVSRHINKAAFKRVIRLSRKEYVKRNKLRQKLREKNLLH